MIKDAHAFKTIVEISGGNITENDAFLLYETAMRIEAKTILEIGAREGGSSMVLGCVARANGGHLFSIEPKLQQKWYINMDQYGLLDHVTLLAGMAPWVDLSDFQGQFDYILDDGDHRTRWILANYHVYEPCLRPGGHYAIHDWTGARGVDRWVRRAVEIILEDDELKEVGRNEEDKCGLIVFEKPGDVESFSRRCNIG